MKFLAASTAAALVVIFSAVALGTEFHECHSYLGDKIGVAPLNVTIDGCDKLPCDIQRGTNMSGRMFFKPDQDMSVMTPEVTVYWMGFPIHWPINQTDGCTTLTENHCPVKANTVARYEYSLPIKDGTPLVSPLMRYEFKDGAGHTTICCELPLRIVENALKRSAISSATNQANNIFASKV